MSAGNPTTDPRKLTRIELWTENWSDRFNPILVREVRQILKSRQFAFVFLGLLALAWLASTATVLYYPDLSSLISDVGFSGMRSGVVVDGRPLFGALSLLLSAVLFFPVPMTAFQSVTDEHREAALEMLQVSGLSSHEIVWGKLYGSLLQALIYLSAVAPFLAVTYLLQGVGILAIGGMLLMLLGTCFSLCSAGLAAGSFSTTPLRQMFGSLVMVGLAACAFCASILLQDAMSSATNSVPVFFCLTIPISCLTILSLSIAHAQVRPTQFTTVRVDFIDHKRLQEVAVLMQQWLATNQEIEKLLSGATGNSTKESRAELGEAYQRGGNEATQVDRVMNATRDYFLRFNFVTFQEGTTLLLSLRKLFDEVVIARRWIYGKRGIPVIGPMAELPKSLPSQVEQLRGIEQALNGLNAVLAAIDSSAEPVISDTHLGREPRLAAP